MKKSVLLLLFPLLISCNGNLGKDSKKFDFSSYSKEVTRNVASLIMITYRNNLDRFINQLRDEDNDFSMKYQNYSLKKEEIFISKKKKSETLSKENNYVELIEDKDNKTRDLVVLENTIAESPSGNGNKVVNHHLGGQVKDGEFVTIDFTNSMYYFDQLNTSPYLIKLEEMARKGMSIFDYGSSPNEEIYLDDNKITYVYESYEKNEEGYKVGFERKAQVTVSDVDMKIIYSEKICSYIPKKEYTSYTTSENYIGLELEFRNQNVREYSLTDFD